MINPFLLLDAYVMNVFLLIVLFFAVFSYSFPTISMAAISVVLVKKTSYF